MKITYLFGAGASRNALPIMDEVPDRILEMADLLLDNQFELDPDEKFPDIKLDKTISQLKAELLEDLKWVSSVARNSASIDTYAKKLFIKTKEEDLKCLKRAFSVFLLLEQALNGIDKRYDTFYASILDGSHYPLPAEIRVLSWNYDLQFELAYSEFSGQKEIHLNQALLGMVKKHADKRIEKDRFSIYKLNGTANFYSESGYREHQFCSFFPDRIDLDYFKEILKSYALLKYFSGSNLFSGLSFAWEGSYRHDKDIIEIAKNETSETNILIVIGYSFPFFNRSIDRNILGNMKDLRKIYLQSPEAPALQERIKTILPEFSNDRIVQYIDTKQFLLPDEL